jgi:hypothetical protein
MEIKNSSLFMCRTDIESQMLKLSAWVQTLHFIIETWDTEGGMACENTVAAAHFAKRHPTYSAMLHLVLSGLQECKDTIEMLYDKESELINVAE